MKTRLVVGPLADRVTPDDLLLCWQVSRPPRRIRWIRRVPRDRRRVPE